MKMRKKSNLPSKHCVTCSLPFNWRKKWEKEWENVKYCSERCRRSVTSNNMASAVNVIRSTSEVTVVR